MVEEFAAVDKDFVLVFAFALTSPGRASHFVPGLRWSLPLLLVTLWVGECD